MIQFEIVNVFEGRTFKLLCSCRAPHRAQGPSRAQGRAPPGPKGGATPWPKGGAPPGSRGGASPGYRGEPLQGPGEGPARAQGRAPPRPIRAHQGPKGGVPLEPRGPAGLRQSPGEGPARAQGPRRARPGSRGGPRGEPNQGPGPDACAKRALDFSICIYIYIYLYIYIYKWRSDFAHCRTLADRKNEATTNK